MNIMSTAYRFGISVGPKNAASGEFHVENLPDILSALMHDERAKAGDIMMLEDMDSGLVVAMVAMDWSRKGSMMTAVEALKMDSKVGSDLSLQMLIRHPTLGGNAVH